MITDVEILELEELTRLEDVDRGIADFWTYCKLTSPDYYDDDRLHLKTLAETLQGIYEGKILKEDGTPYRKIIINMPPQHGKTRTLVRFCQWVLGRNQRERIIAGSYNDLLATEFSKFTRDGIQEIRNSEDGYVFSDFFPGIRTRYGSESYHRWALEGQHFNYLGAGILGGITGKAGTIRIIDDPVKSAKEAYNENRLDEIWKWYTGTFLSRRNSEMGEPFDVIVMTRWADGDIAGRILSGARAKDWFLLKMEARDELTGEMLCERSLSKVAYDELSSTMDSFIFMANYHQRTIDQKGILYKQFKTYTEVPCNKNGRPLFEAVKNYTDTADQGSDFLVSINFGVYKGEAYVLNVLYTKEGMEITEPMTAEFLFRGRVNEAKIESNNGGRGFARNVQRLIWENHKTKSVIVKWFHQSENKVARILSNSAFIQEHVYFPVNWKDRWPEYHRAMTTYLKEGKNKHDDAQDATTGIVEELYQPQIRIVTSA